MKRIPLVSASIVLLLFLPFGYPGNSFAQDTLHIGIIRFKTPELVLQTYEPLFEKVAKELDRVVSLKLVDETDLGYTLNEGMFDIGIFPPFAYLRSKEDFPDLAVFGSHLIGGSDQFDGAIMTLQTAPIQKILDLRGKRMMFVKPSSTSGFLFPKGVLKEHQIDIEAGDLSFEFSGGHDLSLMALLNHKVDAIAVDKRAVSEMDSLIEQVKVIFPYSIPYHAYVFSPKLDQEIRNQIKTSIFQAHKNPLLKGLFPNSLGISQWSPQNDSYYNPLRRFLRFVRVKPTLKLTIEVKNQASEAFKSKGDLLDLLRDNLANELRETHRFLVTNITHQNHYHSLDLDISLIDEAYHCQIYLDDKRIEYFTDISLDQFVDEVPMGITKAVLDEFVIESEILHTGEEWFITFGTNDGLTTEDYQFTLVKSDETTQALHAEHILSIDPLNTYLSPSLPLGEGDKLIIGYRGTEFENSLHSNMPGEIEPEESFWQNKDNQWGVIGLVVTLIGVIIGSFFSTRKKKRFRTMLYESNKLLLEYIQGRYKLDNEIIAHKDKINQFLEKGYISENQYLILRNRVDDIHHLINQIMNHPEDLELSLRKEVEDIIQDGVITEKEYSRLVAMVQKNKPES